MTSGRVAASCSFCAPNSLAISQSGPSRLTKCGKIGVCGTPNPPTICAMSFCTFRGPDLARPLCNISANGVEGNHGTQIWTDQIWTDQIWTDQIWTDEVPKGNVGGPQRRPDAG